MMRWIAGAVVGAVGLLGLFWAASAGSGESGYVLGMLVALAALVALFVLLKGHFDAQEHAAPAKPAKRGAARGGAGRTPAAPALGVLPANVPDNMVIAMLAGILSLGGGIVATYTTGLGSAFGMLMFLGFGAVVLATGWRMWSIGFVEDDRQDA